MFKRLRVKYLAMMTILRGETLDQVLSAGNKQLEKLEIVKKNFDSQIDQSRNQAKAYRDAARALEKEASKIKNKACDTEIIKGRLEATFKVSPEERSEFLKLQ